MSTDLRTYIHEASHCVTAYGHHVTIMKVNQYQTEFLGGSAQATQGYATVLLAGSVGQAKWLQRPYALTNRNGLDDLMKLSRLFRQTLGSQLVRFLNAWCELLQCHH
jgi:hypothetical protein